MQDKLTLQAFEQYLNDFRFYSYKLDNIPWLYKTILYLPIGMIIENYWLHKMAKCNREYKIKYLTPPSKA